MDNLKLGKRVTLIYGEHGTGKSVLLSKLSSKVFNASAFTGRIGGYSRAIWTHSAEDCAYIFGQPYSEQSFARMSLRTKSEWQIFGLLCSLRLYQQEVGPSQSPVCIDDFAHGLSPMATMRIVIRLLHSYPDIRFVWATHNIYVPPTLDNICKFEEINTELYVSALLNDYKGLSVSLADVCCYESTRNGNAISLRDALSYDADTNMPVSVGCHSMDRAGNILEYALNEILSIKYKTKYKE